MGSREEFCLTIAPEQADADGVARAVATALSTYPGGIDVSQGWVSDDALGRFADPADSGLSVFLEAGRVYAYGVSFDGSEVRFWRNLVLGLGVGDGWALAVHTQEAGYVGRGWLYEWNPPSADVLDVVEPVVVENQLADTDPDGWQPVDQVHDHGGYDEAVRSYFDEEHGLFARSFAGMTLDALPGRDDVDGTSYVPPDE